MNLKLIRQFIFGCLILASTCFYVVPSEAAENPSNQNWVKLSEIQLGGGGSFHDLAFDGSQWHVATSFNNFWKNFSPTFTPLGTTPVTGVSDMRGLAFSDTLNQLIVGDQDTGIIRFVELNGTVHSQFSINSFELEGLDFDDRDSSVWVGLFDGRIQQWSSTGQLLFSFNGLSSIGSSFGWSSVAVDPTVNHVYAMHDSDAIYEFTMAGQFVGKILNDPFLGDSFTGNGLGLEYDASARLLRATTQSGRLATFLGVPEPSGLLLLFLAYICGCVGWDQRSRISHALS